MEWYYSSNGNRIGPISEADFQALVKSDKITSDTLVWHEGMREWQTYASVAGRETSGAGASTEQICVECGKTFSEGEMVHYENSWICASCKPVFFQKLKQGVEKTGDFVYGGFWIRFCAKFVDGIILYVVNFGLGFVFGIITQGQSAKVGAAFFLLCLIQFAVGVAYSTWFVGKFGATPGKMSLHLKVIRPDGSRVSYPRALGRYFAEILSALVLYIGYIMVAFDEEKRGLHDRICDTRVIKV